MHGFLHMTRRSVLTHYIICAESLSVWKVWYLSLFDSFQSSRGEPNQVGGGTKCEKRGRETSALTDFTPPHRLYDGVQF